MDVEGQKNSTSPPNSTRKKPWLWIPWILALLLIFILPLYSVQEYADILMATPAPLPNIKADCGVVLTGAPGRVREGINLLSHGAVEKLVISGVHQGATLPEMFPEVVYYPEIHLENVILERRSATTAGNAQQSLPIVETLQCKTVLLVTHDYHMHRALKTFLQAFPPAIRLVAYPIVSGKLHRHRARDMRFWSAVFEEWYKYIFYSIFVF